MQTEDIHYKLYEGRDKESPDREDRKDNGRKGRKPGRKSAKVDMKAKLERSRQSARECRARKKLRYQYLEELVANRERAVLLLRKELEMYRQWCRELDEGRIPEGALKMVEKEKKEQLENIKKEQEAENSV
ncbi:cAMP-responsive element-binding protein-like 2 [Centruroides sculpturatus]|uniref:cAMP-responsive element-binding protein-like 2 n=1 Tax=Centruroides sculpturatus TaxID=218467 RepID=UPI000C6DA51C|nr:cAMP-responsive element-binding protein-like 2 [Centruroides sculpturatus]